MPAVLAMMLPSRLLKMETRAHAKVLCAVQTDTFEAVKVNVYNLIGELAVRLRGPQVGLWTCRN